MELLIFFKSNRSVIIDYTVEMQEMPPQGTRNRLRRPHPWTASRWAWLWAVRNACDCNICHSCRPLASSVQIPCCPLQADQVGTWDYQSSSHNCSASFKQITVFRDLLHHVRRLLLPFLCKQHRFRTRLLLHLQPIPVWLHQRIRLSSDVPNWHTQCLSTLEESPPPRCAILPCRRRRLDHPLSRPHLGPQCFLEVLLRIDLYSDIRNIFPLCAQ